VQARLDARRAAGDLCVRRNVDGIGKKIDVGTYLLDAQAGVGAESLTEAGIAGELLPITLRLRILGGGAARATEALEALLGVPNVHARIVRTALRGTRTVVSTDTAAEVTRTFEPLDLEGLRRMHTRMAQALAEQHAAEAAQASDALALDLPTAPPEPLVLDADAAPPSPRELPA
jgi:hypothetical protein